jgi:hypothetical protein
MGQSSTESKGTAMGVDTPKALTTIGLDAGYSITPALKASVGYYYQHDEKEVPIYQTTTDGSDVRLRLAYDLTNQLQAGVHYSHDNNFQSRGTGDLKFRFGTGSSGKNSQQLTMPPVVQALTATPTNRDVRVANSTANPRDGASAY